MGFKTYEFKIWKQTHNDCGPLTYNIFPTLLGLIHVFALKFKRSQNSLWASWIQDIYHHKTYGAQPLMNTNGCNDLLVHGIVQKSGWYHHLSL